MLLTYLLVILVVVVLLFASFRALGGGGEPISADDYRTVLARLTEFTAARASELGEALESPLGAEGSADPAVEAAAAARKKLGGYLQQLSRLDFAASDAERADLDATRSQLERAIEDFGWACRMVEAGLARENPGIRSAVDGLRAHGEACLAAVQATVAPR
jgi:hypothetical protein